MCCCHVQSCCCGCKPLGPGVFILSIINIFVNVSMIAAPRLLFTVMSEEGYTGWLFILGATNLSSAVGAKTNIKLLLLPWLICYMINIVLTLVICPIIIVAGIVAVSALREHHANTEDDRSNRTWNFINTFLPGEGAKERFLQDFESNNPEEMEDDIFGLVSILLACFLPVWLIYCWIVTKSLYFELSVKELELKQNSNARRVPRANRIGVISYPMYEESPQYISPGQYSTQQQYNYAVPGGYTGPQYINAVQPQYASTQFGMPQPY